MPKIVNVLPKDDFTLEIDLDNQHKIIYDLKPRLHAIRFCNLGDINKFKSVKVENDNTLVWDTLCQITIDEIIYTIER